jgi:GDP-4-dehydro-6-deoxy-D-mannose reductase
MSGPILITGAAGFVGTHLLALLQEQGRPVVAWRLPSHLPASGTPHALAPTRAVRWAFVNLLDRDRVREAVAVEAPSAIYHLAGAAHVGHSWDRSGETLETNVLGTEHLLEAVQRAGLRSRVLIPGSSTVYARSDEPITEAHPIGPDSPYALSKLAQERLGARSALDDDLPVLLTRSFNHIGPGQSATFVASSFARQIALIEAGRQDPVLRVGNLDARRDLTDVRDTVRAYRLLMERGEPGRIYNVCSGRAYSIRDLLDGLLASSQARVQIETDPSLLRPIDNPLVIGDPTRIRQATGWRADIPLARTLHDLLDFWRTTAASPENRPA